VTVNCRVDVNKLPEEDEEDYLLILHDSINRKDFNRMKLTTREAKNLSRDLISKLLKEVED